MLIRYLNRIKKTYQNDGASGVMSKLKMRTRYLALRLSAKKKTKGWEGLKGKFKGKRVFLIGNGPSLNKTPLYLLKDEYKMCFNRFYLMLERLNWDIDFYSTVDNLVLDDLVNEMDSISKMSKYMFLPDIHFRGTKYIDQIKDYDNLYWMQHKVFGSGFSPNLPKVYGGGSVIYEGMQILRYLGFEEIVLIGVDMSYQIHKNVNYLNDKTNDIKSKEDDDPNHFDPRYFGKGRKYHQPEQSVVNHILNSLQFVSTITEQRGFKIVNAGYDSKVPFFEMQDFHEYLNLSDDDREMYFNQCVLKHSPYSNVNEMESALENVELADEAEGLEGSFTINLEEGLKVIKKKIFTHLPLGPYNGKYFFLKK